MDDSTTPLFFQIVKEQGFDPRNSDFLTHQQFMEKYARVPLSAVPMPKKSKGPKTAADVAEKRKPK